MNDDNEVLKKLYDLYSKKTLSEFLAENPINPGGATESYRFDILNVEDEAKKETKRYDRRSLSRENAERVAEADDRGIRSSEENDVRHEATGETKHTKRVFGKGRGSWFGRSKSIKDYFKQ